MIVRTLHTIITRVLFCSPKSSPHFPHSPARSRYKLVHHIYSIAEIGRGLFSGSRPLSISKLTVIPIVVSLFVIQAPARGASSSSRLRDRFAHPLIIGASVSAGFPTPGPGTVATELITGFDSSKNISAFGAEARHFANINRQSLADYSSIIAVDLFFWDSTLPETQASEAALSNLINSAQRAKVPLVIGDVPQLLSRQVEDSRRSLNRLIHSRCTRSRGCYLLELDQIHRIASREGLMINGERYFYDQMTFDGLHLLPVGSHYLAKRIIEKLGEPFQESHASSASRRLDEARNRRI